MFGVAPPTDIFGTTYTANETGVTIPLASLPGVSAQEANKDNGDFRRVLRGILESAYTGANNLSDAPGFFSIAKSGLNGIGGNRVRVSYTVSFDMEVTEAEVITEEVAG
ncbi:MAG: hypothetical protein ACFCBU_07900 [Cyanophyceae cyanobacterium]